jgi:hypothetical protein
MMKELADSLGRHIFTRKRRERLLKVERKHGIPQLSGGKPLELLEAFSYLRFELISTIMKLY